MAKNKNPIPNPYNRKRKDFKTVRQYYNQLARDNGFKNYHQLEQYREKNNLKDRTNRGRRPAKKKLSDGSYTINLKFNNGNYDRQAEELQRIVEQAPIGSDIQLMLRGNVYGGAIDGKKTTRKGDWDWKSLIPEVKEQLLERAEEHGGMLEYLRDSLGVRDITYSSGRMVRGVSEVRVRVIPSKRKK